MDTLIEGCLISPLKIVPKDGGQIRRGLRASDIGYEGFSEIYFSSIDSGVTSDWKRHKRMTLNIVVPVGEITFFLYDDRIDSTTYSKFFQITLGENRYCRLTVPPNIWVAFRGLTQPTSMLANIANMEHDPDEADREPISKFDFFGGLIS